MNGAVDGLGPEQMRFARTELAPAFLSRYTAELGKIAQSGQSPFYLSEVSRAQRGIDSGSPAGQALDAALGPGVDQPTWVTAGGPTRIVSIPGATAGGAASGGSAAGGQSAMLQQQLAHFQEIEAAQKQIQETGEGVPREFIALPKLMPGDFLSKEMTPGNIKMLYEGSRRGAGSFASSGSGGTVARRV